MQTSMNEMYREVQARLDAEAAITAEFGGLAVLPPTPEQDHVFDSDIHSMRDIEEPFLDSPEEMPRELAFG